MGTLLVSALALGGMGLLLGVVLTYAGIKFKVEEDPRLAEIMDVLPGANCGGCGYPGCGGFAQAVLDGKVRPEACPPGGSKSAEAIGKILGIEVDEVLPQKAFIRCTGSDSLSRSLYIYDGMDRCGAAVQLSHGGAKACSYGCLGLGSCRAVCVFEAIDIEDGLAKINEKCTACGVCVPVCPKKLIVMVPHDSTVHVACNSKEPAKTVREKCDVGCIGCRACIRVCPHEAILFEDFLATIDYEKCTQCLECAKKCPTRCILVKGERPENGK